MLLLPAERLRSINVGLLRVSEVGENVPDVRISWDCVAKLERITDWLVREFLCGAVVPLSHLGSCSIEVSTQRLTRGLRRG